MSKPVVYGVAAFLLNCCVFAPAQAGIIVNVNGDSRTLPIHIAPDDYPYGQGLSAWQDLKNNPWVVSQTRQATTPIATSSVADTESAIAATLVSGPILSPAEPDLAYVKTRTRSRRTMTFREPSAFLPSIPCQTHCRNQ